MRTHALIFIALLIPMLFGCEEGSNIDKACILESLGQYPNQETSDYILPLYPGEAYKVGKGNCSSKKAHLAGSPTQYAYDFLMPIGTTILASKEGTVLKVEEAYPDSTRVKGEENVVVIKHLDDSLAVYAHLTTQGALVEEGDVVEIGQPIGLSGDSGASTVPHLHFHVQTACAVESESCISNQPLPITFKNTKAHPNGLIQGETYYALPW